VESRAAGTVVPVASGSGNGRPASGRGNKCWDADDVRLLEIATADYKSTLVTTYAPITAERVLGLLRANGGQYADMADRYQVRVNGRRILADRVRYMVQAEHRGRG